MFTLKALPVLFKRPLLNFIFYNQCKNRLRSQRELTLTWVIKYRKISINLIKLWFAIGISGLKQMG